MLNAEPRTESGSRSWTNGSKASSGDPQDVLEEAGEVSYSSYSSRAPKDGKEDCDEGDSP